jgi:hypothetical protein
MQAPIRTNEKRTTIDSGIDSNHQPVELQRYSFIQDGSEIVKFQVIVTGWTYQFSMQVEADQTFRNIIR